MQQFSGKSAIKSIAISGVINEGRGGASETVISGDGVDVSVSFVIALSPVTLQLYRLQRGDADCKHY